MGPSLTSHHKPALWAIRTKTSAELGSYIAVWFFLYYCSITIAPIFPPLLSPIATPTVNPHPAVHMHGFLD